MPEAQGFLISENLSLIFYLNFCQFKGGMFLFFFLISGVLGYIFLISEIIYKNMLLRAWKLTMYCKIWPFLYFFFLYAFAPKIPTYRTFQGIPYLNLGSEVSYFLFFLRISAKLFLISYFSKNFSQVNVLSFWICWAPCSYKSCCY